MVRYGTRVASVVALVALVLGTVVLPPDAAVAAPVVGHEDPSPSVASTPAASLASSPVDLDAACPAPIPPAGFVDVDAAGTHGPAIGCLVAYAVTQGVTADTYQPASTVTRAQMATFLVRLLATAGARPAIPASPRFSDVSGVHADNIEALATTGITTGTTATTYDPQGAVTRAQMATFLDRLVTSLALPLAAAAPRFDDVDPSGIHAGAIGRLAASGVVQGRTATSYAPGAPVTRAQMGSFLMRTNDLLAQEELTHPPYVEQPTIIDDAVVVLDAQQRAELEVLDLDLVNGEATLGFTTLPAGLELGDIVVSEPTDGAPDGLLVEVVAIGASTIEGRLAALTDAVLSGSGDATAVFEPGDLADEEFLVDGLERTAGAATTGWPLADDAFALANGVELFGLDFADVEVAPGVIANGGVDLQVRSDIDLDIGVRRLVQPYIVNLEATSTLSQRAELDLTASGNASFDRKVELYRATFAPITFTIGPVPVVLTPKLTVELQANGQVSASVSYRAAQSASATVGARYQPASGWRPIASWDADFTQGIRSVEAQGAASLTATATPTLALYGAVDIGASVTAGIRYAADLNADPSWGVYASTEVDYLIGLNLPLLPDLPSYRQTVFRNEWMLATSRTDPDAPEDPVDPVEPVDPDPGDDDGDPELDDVGWPTHRSDGSSALYAYIGALLIGFPSWVSCTPEWCVARVGDDLHIFNVSSGIDYYGRWSIAGDDRPPAQILAEIGFTEEDIAALLA